MYIEDSFTGRTGIQVASEFDGDGHLEFDVGLQVGTIPAGSTGLSTYLGREQAKELRDHLTKVLGDD